MANMGATKENYIFKNKNIYECFFKTSNRKRNGQLNKFSIRNLESLEVEFTTEGLKKIDYDERINKNKINKFSKILEEPEKLISYLNYNGNDLKVFKTKELWYPWQSEIYDWLFDSNKKIQQADDRSIISLVDFRGNSGKSSFFKWLFLQNSESIGRITYGSSSQLRSIITKANPKKLYIIDLPRTKGRNDNDIDLLSAIENLKSGLVINSM